MASSKIAISLGACAAAVGCAFSVGASAQSLEAKGRALLDGRASSAAMNAVHGGTDRAIRPPLEVIWLQADVHDKMWRDPSLAHVLQGCTRTGAPKEGCAVTVRSAWRYTFDANSAVRPAAIVVSSPHLRQAPSGAARLNLTGSGRVYIVTPHESGTGALRPPSGAILLAAGTAVQLVDVAYPSIQVEIKAPDNEGLFLGNLAESDVTKVVALLVKQPGLLSASAASVLGDGKVALHAPATGAESIQLAAIAPAKVAAEFEPALSSVASVDLSALAGNIDMPARGVARVTEEPVLDRDFTPLAAALEKSDPLPVPMTIASIDLSAMKGWMEMPVRDLARVAAPPQPVQARDVALVAAALERATPLPVVFAIASADFSATAGTLEMPAPVTPSTAPVPLPPARAEPAPAPVQVAMASPVPAGSADLARMRAEVEAEIARERERMAQALQGRSAPRFRFGT